MQHFKLLNLNIQVHSSYWCDLCSQRSFDLLLTWSDIGSWCSTMIDLELQVNRAFTSLNSNTASVIAKLR